MSLLMSNLSISRDLPVIGGGGWGQVGDGPDLEGYAGREEG